MPQGGGGPVDPNPRPPIVNPIDNADRSTEDNLSGGKTTAGPRFIQRQHNYIFNGNPSNPSWNDVTDSVSRKDIGMYSSTPISGLFGGNKSLTKGVYDSSTPTNVAKFQNWPAGLPKQRPAGWKTTSGETYYHENTPSVQGGAYGGTLDPYKGLGNPASPNYAGAGFRGTNPGAYDMSHAPFGTKYLGSTSTKTTGSFPSWGTGAKVTVKTPQPVAKPSVSNPTAGSLFTGPQFPVVR